ncbi:MAG TPA: glycosyltransferase, partial [Opitutaceae bacterium]|nr:glycosyltransferase [Opitutaceae bacterium]
MVRPSPPTLVVITQVFPPDPAAVGAYLEDASRELVKRGWRLRIFTADRGYDNPSIRFPRVTQGEGFEVRRLSASSAGKSSLRLRLTGMVGFLLQAGLRTLWQPDLAGIVVSTSPPLAPGIATVVAWIRRVPVIFWAMDLNPQQAVAAGLLSPRSWSVRALGAVQRWVLRRAALTITLDSAMEQNLGREAPTSVRAVVPLWPRSDDLGRDYRSVLTEAGGDDANDHLTLLYSGNHSPVHPLETVLLAA